MTDLTEHLIVLEFEFANLNGGTHVCDSGTDIVLLHYLFVINSLVPIAMTTSLSWKLLAADSMTIDSTAA